MNWKLNNIDFGTFGVYVSKSSGVLDMPRMVDASIDWLDQDGKDYWQSIENVKYEDREINLSCWIEANGYEQFKNKVAAFFSSLTAAGIRTLTTPDGFTINVSLQDAVQVVRKTSYLASFQAGMFNLKLTVTGDDKRKYFYVYSNGQWVTVTYSDGSLKHSLQGIPEITFSTESNSKRDFGAGDYLIFNGEKYVSFDTPSEDQLSSNKYRYKLAFKHQFYFLDDIQFRILGLSNTSLQSTASEIIDLIITNAERRHPGLFVKGTVAFTESKLNTFENESCLSVLTKTANAYELEWDFTTLENGKIQINVKQSIDTPTGLTFEYGKDKELYRVSRPAYSRENICTHLYAYGSDKNLPSSYGYPCLKLPVEPIVFEYDGDPVERTKVFDIKPERTGEVTSYTPGTPFEIVDSSMDFDLKEVDGSGNTKWLINGQSAKVVFISGDLAGFEFEVQDYIHANKTFKLLPYTDETGASYPTEVLFPSAGDEYKILDINVPDSYVTDAENRLSVAANAWLNDLMTKTMPNELETKPRSSYQALKPGNLVTLKHTGSGIEKTSRISEISTNLMNFVSVITLSNTVNTPLLAQISNNISNIESSVAAVKAGTSKYWQKTELVNDVDNYLSVGGAKTKAGYADNSGLLNNLPDTKFLRKDIDQEVAAKTAWKDLISALFGFKAGLAGNTYLELISELVALKKSMGTEAFQAGFAGNGWRMDIEENSLTIDNLTVRKSMEVYELIINQIRATNGALWVSDSAKISAVTDGGTYWKCYIDTDGGNNLPPFVSNDWIRCQKWTGRGVKYYSAKVTSVGADYFNITKTGIDGAGVPEAGDSVVRIGNATNPNRQGAIYLTSSDNNSPYLDVLDGVDSPNLAGKTKVRLGKLDGINDPQFGALQGYGMFGENVYLKGEIEVTGGNAETLTGAQAKVDAVQIGGRNLVLNSKQTITGTGRLQTFNLAEPLVPGETYTATLCGVAGAGAIFRLWADSENEATVTLNYGELKNSLVFVYVGTFGNHSVCSVYSEQSSNPSTMYWIQIEKGNKPSDWSPNPEDLRAEINENKNYVDAVKADLQSQIDGNITSWFFDYEPTLANVPASNWVQDGVREIHLGDLFYWTSKGFSYRFQKVGTVFSWTRIADTDVTKALADAARAQDTADGKRRNFAIQPFTPYDAGDLWSQGASGELMRCINSRAIGAFVASDWDKAVKYTDDTAVNNLQIGGRNLLLNTDRILNVGLPEYSYAEVPFSVFEQGEEYCWSFDAKVEGAFPPPFFRVYTQGVLMQNGQYYNPFFQLINATQEWKRYSITFIWNPPSPPIGSNLEMSFYCDYGSGSLPRIRRPKLELGNKATDWTPAPEDVQAGIDEAKQAASNAQSTANNANTAIGNLNTYVDNSFRDGVIEASEAKAIEKYKNVITDSKISAENEYNNLYVNSYLEGSTKVNLLNAKISLFGAIDNLLTAVNTAIADGKTTTSEKADVDSKYALYITAMGSYKASVESASRSIQDKLNSLSTDKVNAVRIGGRNLLRNSGLEKGGISEYLDYASLTTLFDQHGTGDFMLSFELKLAIPGSVNVYSTPGGIDAFKYVFETHVINGTDQYVRYVLPISVVLNNPLSTWTSLSFYAEYGSGRIVSVRNVKIERGNKATDWTPAPEDVDAKIAAIEYLKEAMQGSTEIQGGLVNTNVMQMKNAAGTTTAGMSGLANDGLDLWTAGTYAQALAGIAKNIFFSNGSLRLADGAILYDVLQNALTISALVRSAASGARVEISKESNSITIFDANNVARMKLAPKNVMSFADIGGTSDVITLTYPAHSASTTTGATNIGSTELLVLNTTKFYDITTPAVGVSLYSIGYRDGITKENFVGAASVEVRLVDTIKNTVVWTRVSNVSSGTTTPATDTTTIPSSTIAAMPGSTYRIDVLITATNEGNGSDASAYASIAAGQTLNGTTMVSFSEMGFDGFNFINDNAHYLHYGPDGFAYKGALNFPGVLASGSVAVNNAHYNKWGAKVATDAQPITKGGTGVYIVPHNLGSAAFTVHPTPTTDSIDCRLTGKTDTYFQVTCRNTSNVLTDASFDYVMIGSN